MKKYFFCFVLIFFTQNIFSSMPIFGGVSSKTSVSEEPSYKVYKAVLRMNYGKAKEILLNTQNVDLNAQHGEQGDTILNLLIRQRHITMAEYIISLGADINCRIKNGQTPLHEAAGSEKGEITSRLIDLGADVHAVDNQGWTPLHFAAFYWDISAIKALKEKGADIYAHDRKGNTPLHIIGHYGEQSLHNLVDIHFIIAPLMKSKTDIYLRNKQGRTPLHEAVWSNGLEAVNAFLNLAENAYAYANEQDHNGLSAIDIARKKQKKHTLRKGIMILLSPYSTYFEPSEIIRGVVKSNFFRRCFTLFSRAH